MNIFEEHRLHRALEELVSGLSNLTTAVAANTASTAANTAAVNAAVAALGAAGTGDSDADVAAQAAILAANNATLDANTATLVAATGGSTPPPPPPPAGPTVTGLSSSTGPVAGGLGVTISGTGFAAGVTAVDFGPDPAAAFQELSDGAINATSPVPSGGAGTVDVTVTTPEGTSATSPADQFTTS